MCREGGGTIHILHVEDDADFASLTREFLEREDERFAVETASNSEAGLDRLESDQFDCVVSDYDMPGRNGIEFLAVVRERWPDLPFILYTGKGSEEVASEAVSGGVTDYLQKETGSDQYTLLANRIDNAVSRAQATDRLRTLERRYRTLFAEMNEGMALHELVYEDGDPIDYEFVEVNDNFERILDMPAADVIGGRASAVFEPEAPPYLDRYATVVETGESTEFETFYPPLGRYFHVSVFSPAEGRFATVFSDITDRKERERERKRAETFFEHTQDGAFLVDVGDDEFVIERVNPAYETQSGIDAGRIEGKTPREAVGSDQGDQIEARYRECLEREAPIEYEERLQLDGEVTVWWTRLAPVVVEDTVEQIVGSTREISDRKERQRALERFEAAAENAGHAIYFTDPAGTIEYVNPAFERITGYDAADVIGENPRILQSGEMDEAYYDGLWETLLAGELWEEEVVNQRRDGEQYTAHQTIAPITADDGEIAGFVAIQSDITDQRERQRQLERTVETYEQLFHGVGDAVFVVEPGRGFLAVNDTACERLGYERAELLEMGPADIDAEHSEQRVAETHEQIEQAGSSTFESVHVSKTGERIPVEIRASAIEYFGTDAILSVVRDVTDRVEHERELERSRNLLAHSQRLADVGAWEYDVTEGTVRTTGQQRRMFGVETGEEMDLATALDVYHPADRDRVETALERASSHGVGFDYRLRIVPDDERRWVRVTGEPKTDDGEITGVQGAVREITAEYRRRQELEDNERALRDIQEVVVDDDRSFEGQIEALLEIGRQRTGLSVGYLTEVESGTVEVIQLVGDPEGFDVGRRFPLAETFCRKVIEDEAVFSMHDAVGQGYDDDPGYEQFGLEAYIGAPFFVEGDLRGTICFADRQPRSEPFSAMERTFVRTLVQQVGALFARRHRRTQLRTLHEATRSLFGATTPDDIPRMTTEAVEAITDAFALAFYRWDDETGDLRRAAHTTTDDRDSDVFDRSIGPGDGPIWDAFVREGQTFETLDAGEISSATAHQIHAVPVDDVGVLAAVPRQGAERPAFERTFLETLARNVSIAFDTLEQTETLQEYTARLERQNEHLERLRRINAIIRDIQQTVAEATTRSEVEDAVCRNLTSIDHWELAWIGEPSVADTGLTVRATSDESAASLATIETADGSIAGQAFEGGHFVEVANIASAEASGQWRRTALELGCQAAIAIPISYGTREYGVLEIYADQPGTFTEEERHVLAELGTTIAYAITSLERSRTLQSGGGVELEVTVPPAEEFLLGLGETLEGELAITNVVQRTDGSYLAYATAADAGTVAETLSTDPLVERATTFGTDDAEQIELEFRESQLLDVLDAYDARVHRLVATAQTNRLTVFFPRTDTVREFVEHLEDSYPDATLQAQRTVEADRTTSLAGALESLTDRQREILTIAYRRGFFEWPRESSGEEIAEAIGIAPATFHQHIRTVQQNVLESLFGSGT